MMQYVSFLGGSQSQQDHNPVVILNVHLSLLGERFVPTKVIRLLNKEKHFFIMTAGVRSTSIRRLIFGRFMITHELAGMSFSITRGGLM